MEQVIAESPRAGGAGHHGDLRAQASRRIPIRRTYAEADVGAAVAVVGSLGFIEVAVRDGDAAQTLRLSRGDTVVLRTAPLSSG